MHISESYLYNEIFEQPAVIQRVVDENQDIVAALCDIVKKRGIQHVLIAARGTSDNAGRYAKYLFGAQNQLLVSLAAPSLFTIYKNVPDLSDILVIGISQSGRSPDINTVIDMARKQGALTVAICNDASSALAQNAEYFINLYAGPEMATAATKSYTAELAAIALISVFLRNDQHALRELEAVPEAVQACLQLDGDVHNLAASLVDFRHMAIVGRGYNYPTAFELALKLKELTYTFAQAYSSADFMHGPLALVENHFPLVVIAPSGALDEELYAFSASTRQLGATLIGISDSQKILGNMDFLLKLPVVVPEWLSAFTAIIPGQLLSMYLAYQRGLSLDQPRTIKKITETL